MQGDVENHIEGSASRKTAPQHHRTGRMNGTHSPTQRIAGKKLLLLLQEGSLENIGNSLSEKKMREGKPGGSGACL